MFYPGFFHVIDPPSLMFQPQHNLHQSQESFHAFGGDERMGYQRSELEMKYSVAMFPDRGRFDVTNVHPWSIQRLNLESTRGESHRTSSRRLQQERKKRQRELKIEQARKERKKRQM